MDKIEEISLKLKNLGFLRINMDKESHKIDFNNDEFINQVLPFAGSVEGVYQMIDELNQELMRVVPDIEFANRKNSILLFIPENKVEIHVDEKVKNCFGDNCFEIYQSKLYKRLELNDFYNLLVEKSLTLDIIMIGSSN